MNLIMLSFRLYLFNEWTAGLGLGKRPTAVPDNPAARDVIRAAGLQDTQKGMPRNSSEQFRFDFNLTTQL